MSQPTALFLRLNQEFEALSARNCWPSWPLRVITPATEASADAAGRGFPASAGDYGRMFPLRSAVRFKTSRLENVNRASDPAVDLHAIIAAANRPPPAAATPNRLDRPTPAAIDVMEILREKTPVPARTEKPVDLTSRSTAAARLPDPDDRGQRVLHLASDRGLGQSITTLYSLAGLIVFSVGITWVV